MESRNVYDESECLHCDTDSFALRYPLMEVADFRIVCDAHPLAQGHILVIPKLHLSSVGAFGCTLFSAFMKVFHLVTSFLCSEYGSYAAFEHGVVGQTVNHAHVHLLPFAGGVAEIVPEQQMLRRVSSMSDLRTIYAKEGGYMFLQIESAKYIVAQDLASPGFFREQFAHALGNPGRGDWRKAHIDPRLRRYFQQDIHELQTAWKKHFRGRGSHTRNLV